ncbi:hypothetical protein C7S18_22380 [Ahniella affigens]|uniref:Uncharacterized protein n=1 Tax=Ahniella affigens TaxID=2021234 RepID=A0A2P1PY30_9GAMM|nr:hypothetical protein [Ahniella affigens]AVP99751.1 hypothetical protein C7S18_22380 [Ahniella affigens]
MNDSNQPSSRQREAAAQSMALQATRARDPSARDYQRIYAAVAVAPMPTLPADLATRILTQVENLAESARTERMLTLSLVLVMAIGCLIFAGPSLVEELAVVQLPKLGSWPMLAAAGVLSALAIDCGPQWWKGRER